MSGVVLFRPGNELLWLFRRGRVVIETPSEAIQHLPSGLIPEAHQPLTDDVSMQELFLNERVIQRAGGHSSLDAWLERKFECQCPHNDWHSKDFTVMRHAPGSIRLCWGCDNQLREQTTERLAGIAMKNLVKWLLERVNNELNAKHPDWTLITCRRRIDAWVSLAESILYAPLCDAFGTNGDRFMLQSEQGRA
ncbi:DUF1133 family protein [Enterobacter mori]|uniref:DUF1133 family protein n=1 Tax=Enterobacter mori TaxID=539813 RepID=UPI003AAD5F5A